MYMSQQVWSILLFYGAVQGTLLAGALLFNPRGRRLANVFLSAMLLNSVIHALPFCLLTIGVLEDFPHTISVAFIFMPAIGPLFYFYTRALLQPDYTPRFLLVAIATLLPGTLRFIELNLGISDMDEAVASFYELLEFGVVPIARESMISLFVVIAYTIVFLFASWKVIKRMEHGLRVQYAGATGRHFKWLKFLAAAVLVMKLHAISTFSLGFAAGKITVDMEFTSVLVKCLFVQSVAIVALFLPEGVNTAVGDLPVRSRRTAVDETVNDRYTRILEEFMDTQKPHRIESLRLADLAEMVSIPARVLSELINDRFRMNYFDFINGHRVEDAKAMMRDSANDQFTLLAVARDAGFKSKSSFNRAFRKHTGTSPSEYRDSIRSSRDSTSPAKLCGGSSR
jgi:AraC-like DNA-binding protein